MSQNEEFFTNLYQGVAVHVATVFKKIKYLSMNFESVGKPKTVMENFETTPETMFFF